MPEPLVMESPYASILMAGRSGASRKYPSVVSVPQASVLRNESCRLSTLTVCSPSASCATATSANPPRSTVMTQALLSLSPSTKTERSASHCPNALNCAVSVVP